MQKFFCVLINSFVGFSISLASSFANAQVGEELEPVNEEDHALLDPADLMDELDIRDLDPLELRARIAELQLRNIDGTVVLPDVLRLELFSHTSYVVEVNDRQFTRDGMMIWSGRTRSSSSLSRLSENLDTTIVVDTRTGEMGVSMEVADGASYAINSVDGGRTYRVSQIDDRALWNSLRGDYRHEVEDERVAVPEAIAPDSVPGGEQDGQGFYVVDVFVGFSNSAASRLGNIGLRANQMIAEVNNGLRNSRVRNVRLRLVGVGRTPNNSGITVQTLRAGESWFAREIREKGPDLLALVQTRTPQDRGGGLAWVSGFVSANGAYAPAKVFRHEVGHNVGALHCPSGGGSPWPYGYGWAVPGRNDIRTHMCGNQINYYSTPNVTVRGYRIGDARVADVARLWRERAPVLSGHRRRTVPFLGGHQRRGF